MQRRLLIVEMALNTKEGVKPLFSVVELKNEVQSEDILNDLSLIQEEIAKDKNLAFISAYNVPRETIVNFLIEKEDSKDV